VPLALGEYVCFGVSVLNEGFSFNFISLCSPSSLQGIGKKNWRKSNQTFLLIPCDEEGEPGKTKIKLNPLLRLETPKQTYSSQVRMHEKTLKVID